MEEHLKTWLMDVAARGESLHGQADELFGNVVITTPVPLLYQPDGCETFIGLCEEEPCP